jgi:hypothetical protein
MSPPPERLLVRRCLWPHNRRRPKYAYRTAKRWRRCKGYDEAREIAARKGLAGIWVVFA